jgi:hypothetical protein
MATEIESGLEDRGGAANAEAIEAWDGPLFERFVRFRQRRCERAWPGGLAPMA